MFLVSHVRITPVRLLLRMQRASKQDPLLVSSQFFALIVLERLRNGGVSFGYYIVPRKRLQRQGLDVERARSARVRVFELQVTHALAAPHVGVGGCVRRHEAFNVRLSSSVEWKKKVFDKAHMRNVHTEVCD